MFNLNNVNSFPSTEAATRCFIKIGVLKNLAKFTGKHLCLSLFFKKGILAQVFSSEFCEIFKNTFLENTSRKIASTSVTAFNNLKQPNTMKD